MVTIFRSSDVVGLFVVGVVSLGSELSFDSCILLVDRSVRDSSSLLWLAVYDRVK